MKQQRIRAWITFLITFAMLFSFGNSYRSTAENSMPAAGEKAYSNVIESSQSLSLSDQCSILNYVDEKEFMANGFTKRVSDEEDLNTYIFERDDGTRGLYMFGEDVKFEDASGNVLEKDISLEKTYGGYTTKQNNVGLLLPDHLSDGIKMSFAGKTLTVYIADDNAVKSEKNGNSIKYINAYGDNAHLVLTPTLSGVKQDIVLDRYTWENQFDIIIFSDSLNPFYDEEGKMFFAETEFDEYRFNVGSLFVYDSAGHFTGGEVEINQIAENEWLMTLSVPQEFLASDNTIFPVTIDPKIEIKSENDSSFIEDTTVYSGKPTLATGTWPYNHTGYLSDGYNIGRMLVRTPGLYNNSTFSSIQASQIWSAKFFIKETSGSAAQEVKLYAYTGTSWSENTATWNNTSPNGSYTLIDTQYPAYGAYTEYNVTNLVKGWKNGTYTASLGFMLKSTDESNVNNAKAFDASESAYSNVQPYMVVYYQPQLFLFSYAVDLNEGESFANLAITNPTTTVLWTSSNPTVATVNSAGVITGVRASATPVTITATVLDPYSPVVSKTCTVYVKIPDGTYFVKNKMTGLYAESSGYLEGNEVYQWALGGSTEQRWTVEYLSNGVYRIKNQMSDLYLAVESLNNTSAKATQYSTASDLSRWYISRTSSGALCLHAKGNLSSGYVIGSELSGNTNGTSIKNMLYSNNGDYKDEWEFTRLLPTRGFEITYTPDDWATPVEQGCNCYAYAINNQVYPETNYIWFKQQPGEYYDVYNNIDFTESSIFTAVSNDYSSYNNTYSVNYCFQRIGRYDVCPAGTYKVALVIGQNVSGEYDYHWYRQDSDGLWSHKLALSAVSRLDSSYQLIIDPQNAARDYTLNGGYNYSIFGGYYAVTAWSNMYDANNYCGYWFYGQGGWTINEIYLFLSLYSSQFCSIEDIAVSSKCNLSLVNYGRVK